MSVKDIVLAASGQSTTPPAATFQIERSLRFNSADSAYLSRTPSVAGNRRTWTWSGWVKRSSTGSAQTLFGVPKADLLDNDSLIFDSSDRLQLYSGSLGAAQRVSTSVYRDLSAWYHIVVAVDTTNATAQNRARIWVNNEEITTWTTNATISQNFEWLINGTTQHNIGRYASAGHFNGYITEVNFIDGQALTPSAFGEIRSTTGVWSPKQYTGSYGTNGFYLPFNDNSSVLNLGRNRIPFEKDPDWQQTVLLLSGDGNQGANNINNPGPPRYLAFTDNSNNNFPITVNGDAYGDNFSPFMTEAGQWSVNFTGSNYLTVPDSAGLEIGSSNFTIECWFYPTAVGNYAFITKDAPSGTRSYGFIAFNDSGVLKTTFFIAGGAQLNSTATLNINAWNFVAVTRSGNTLYISVNGTVNSGSWTSTIPDNGQATWIGAQNGPGTIGNYAVGHISNLRLVIGESVASYQSNFTPPTSPASQTSGGVTASNTKLLLCQSNRFVDNAATPNTITVSGTPLVKPFNPFTTTYSSTNGSGYFDNTGDYLTVTSNAAYRIESNTTWTWECWVYPLSLETTDVLSGNTTNGSSTGHVFYLANGLLRVIQYGVSNFASTATVKVNEWTHLAAVSNANSLTFYMNGVAAGTATWGSGSAGGTMFIAAGYTGGDLFHGYLSNLRYVVGSTQVPPAGGPTSPATNVTNTQLLALQYQGSVRNVGFIDSSPYDHVITRNPLTGPNAPTQGTFSPFSAEPGKWGNYFDGDGDWLSIANNAAFNFGTGDFTIECWFYLVAEANATAGGTRGANIVSVIPSSGTVNGYALYLSGNSTTTGTGIVFENTVSNTGYFATYTATIAKNTWHHVAVARSGTTTKLFFNGAEVVSTTLGNQTVSNFSNATNIGASTFTGYTSNFPGYLSNVRIVKGRAVYTGNFTPSTVPLGATSGGTNPPQGTETSLLTCQSNRFVDNGVANSGTGFTITRNGDVRVTPFSPFAPTAAYSAGTNGGSGYFDTSGDSLTVPYSSTLALGTGDCTIEAWIYLASYPQQFNNIVDVRESSVSYSNNAISFGVENDGTLNFYAGSYSSATHVLETASGKITLNAWYHVALTRASGTTKLYVNGVEEASSTNAWNQTSGTATTLYIGNAVVARQVNGYISNLRIVKGTAVTPPSGGPTAPLTAVTNTQLLCNFTNAGIIDNTGKNNLETVGNAQVDTSVKKFGTGSIKFDGTGDYLAFISNPDTTLGTGDFTIEGWFNSNSISTLQTIIERRSALTARGIAIFLETSTLKIRAGDTSTTAWEVTIDSGTLSSSTWYHFAVTRSGNTWRGFLDGTQIGSSVTWSGTVVDETSTWLIGAAFGGGAGMNGYIDDLRITKVAKYTGNFSVPDAPFALTTVDNNYRQWVPTNFSVTPGAGNDSLVDSPTPYGTDTGVGGEVRGNYCTLNPLKLNGTLANGSLDGSFAASSTATQQVTSTIHVSSGKWYFEVLIGTVGGPAIGRPILGVAKDTASVSVNNTTSGQAWSYYGYSGQKYHTSSAAFGATFTTGDVIGVAVDMDAGNIWFSKNGTWQASGNPSTGANPAFNNLAGSNVSPWVGDDQSVETKSFTLNFGQRPFAYTAPSGFKALCTTNLPNPAVVQGDDHFNTVLWTGNGSTQSITGVGFQPDFVWGKSRTNGTASNRLFDAVRGVQKALYSDLTSAEATESGLTSFDSDGFTLGSQAGMNQSSNTFVAWNWKANGAGVSNTAGSITSTVSANTTAGISVVTYTSGASGNATIGHGLGSAPSMIITKSRTNGTAQWSIFHAAVCTLTTQYLDFTTAARQTFGSSVWGASLPSSAVFGITNGIAVPASTNCVAYCFAAIPGFSAFGSYTGNGSADGPFIYTGFRPRFVLLRASSLTQNWIILDTARDRFNPPGTALLPNTSGAESVLNPALDIVSNGFKLRANNSGWNGSSETIIYAAFAENPFKYALAR
jgi:hypothetical protein